MRQIKQSQNVSYIEIQYCTNSLASNSLKVCFMNTQNKENKPQDLVFLLFFKDPFGFVFHVQLSRVSV